MARHLQIREEAELDIVDGVAWYEEREIGLGASLLLELDAIVERILRAPNQFPLVSGDVRRALLRKFPYSAYFLVTDDFIEFVAVLHQRRNPNMLEGRLSDDAG